MGTPDPLQIDGLGGTKAVTSKIAIVSLSSRDDADIDYEFAQSGVREDVIDYTANCGNISSAVGGFAIDEGLLSGSKVREGRSVDPKVRTREVRIFNTGTQKVLISHVPVDEEGWSVAEGEYSMAAVPGTGAPILMDYRETVGASRNRGLLPTGNARDRIEIKGEEREVEITIGDAGNLIVFVKAEDMGVRGDEGAETLTERKDLLDRVREVRGKAANLVGLCEDWRKVDEESPFMPMLSILSTAPTPSQSQHGDEEAAAHIQARLFLDNMTHPSMAGTASVCTAAMSRTRGTLIYDLVALEARDAACKQFKIAHPLGIIPVAVEVESGEETMSPEFSTLSFIRTARRLMDGVVYVPKSCFEEAGVGAGEGTNGHTNGHVNGMNGTS